jgi:hypothetical protein
MLHLLLGSVLPEIDYIWQFILFNFAIVISTSHGLASGTNGAAFYPTAVRTQIHLVHKLQLLQNHYVNK